MPSVFDNIDSPFLENEQGNGLKDALKVARNTDTRTLMETDATFRPLVERAARLIGTAPEFDDLLQEVFGPKVTHKTHGVTDPQSRLTLRAEIDALVTRLYDLTDTEFAHILRSFLLVDEATKTQTLNTYRDLLRLGKLPDTHR